MQRILGACAFVVALGVLLALIRPSPAIALSLEADVEAHTGLVRTISPTLQAHAAARAAQIAAGGVLTHDGMHTYAEILASGDPATAVQRWHESPRHEPFMHEPRYTEIGCAVAGEGFVVAVCVFAPYVPDPGTPQPVPVPPAEVAPKPPPAPVQTAPIVQVPDTAMRAP